MASKLAGHANAARGDSILWLIGLDEKHGVVGAPSERLEDWYPQVQSEFDAGLAPTLEKDLNVQTDEGQLVALVFRTDRVPYLVKNADARGGEPAYWVPWREGRRTRAASLNRGLAPPSSRLPSQRPHHPPWVPTVPADLFYKAHQECTGLEPPAAGHRSLPLSSRCVLILS